MLKTIHVEASFDPSKVKARAYCIKSGDAVFEHGTLVSEAACKSAENARICKDTQLKEKLDECDHFDDFEKKYPSTASHCYNVAKDIYHIKQMEKPCEAPPVIDWHFGATRSGKTYAACLPYGGKEHTHPDVYYH